MHIWERLRAAQRTRPRPRIARLPALPAGLDGGDEKLGAVGVAAGVSHGQVARAGVLDAKVLVLQAACSNVARLMAPPDAKYPVRRQAVV